MRAVDMALVTIGLYPFVEELCSLASDNRITVVDVGGGHSHILQHIKQSTSNLKRIFILQELQAGVIEDNRKEIEMDGTEL